MFHDVVCSRLQLFTKPGTISFKVSSPTLVLRSSCLYPKAKIVEVDKSVTKDVLVNILVGAKTAEARQKEEAALQEPLCPCAGVLRTSRFE
jgi:hypothetical protein